MIHIELGLFVPWIPRPQTSGDFCYNQYFYQPFSAKNHVLHLKVYKSLTSCE